LSITIGGLACLALPSAQGQGSTWPRRRRRLHGGIGCLRGHVIVVIICAGGKAACLAMPSLSSGCRLAMLLSVRGQGLLTWPHRHRIASESLIFNI